MSSSNSPCAACKFLRRKCTQECVFAPYFPPDQPQKFANIHKVFRASNVAKILNELNAAQREDAVNSLAYEAEARLRDPVYGCVGLISILQHKLKQVQHDLYNAKKELANYIGPSAMLPILQAPGFVNPHPNNSSSSMIPYNVTMLGLPSGATHNPNLMTRESHPHHHQPMLEVQHLAAVAAAREQQEMLRSFEHQQQQQEMARFNGGFDAAGPVGGTGFNQMAGGASMSPSLALGNFEHACQIQAQQEEHAHQHQLQLQPQFLLRQQAEQQPQPP
ncbi:hypothetical protein NMG60_11008097 [Bertholletia excelsa]